MFYKVTPFETEKYILWDFKICENDEKLLQVLSQFDKYDVVKVEIMVKKAPIKVEKEE